MAKRQDVVPAHVSLGRHPKTLRLAAMLDIPVPQAIGHLLFLWWWALEYQPNGNLSAFGIEAIATACSWEGDPPDLLLGLTAAGFLDEVEGGYAIHDWSDHAGSVFSRRRTAARRMKSRRKTEAAAKQDEDGSAVREEEFRG